MVKIEMAAIIAAFFLFILHERYRIPFCAESEPVSKKTLSIKWHFVKGAMQALMLIAIGEISRYEIALFIGSIWWILHDAIINKFALKVGFFHLGDNNRLDIWLKKSIGEKGVFIFKLIMLITSIVLIINI